MQVNSEGNLPDVGRTGEENSPGKRPLGMWLDFGAALIVWATIEFVILRIVPDVMEIASQFGGRWPAPTAFFFWLAGFPGAMVVPAILLGLAMFQFLRVRYPSALLFGGRRRRGDEWVLRALIASGLAVLLLMTFYLDLYRFLLGDNISGL